LQNAQAGLAVLGDFLEHALDDGLLGGDGAAADAILRTKKPPPMM